MNDNKNMPALRFSEFKEEWEERKLGELFTFKNGINASKEQYGKGIKFINVLDIINNDFITYDKIQGSVDVTKEIFLKNQVAYGDVLFQRSSETREEVGQANIYLGKRNVTFGGFVIRGKQISPNNPIFINFLLKTNSARKEIVTKSGGSTRFNVGQQTLSQVKINLPTLPEQQKIANFLTTIDEKINQLTQKKAALDQYKKGVMQQIFNQTIRFKKDDSSAFEDWEVRKLGSLIYKVGKRNKKNIKYPVYSINNKEGFVPQAEQFEGLSSTSRGYDISLYKIVHSNTFAYNPARINIGSIGYSGDLESIIVSSLYVCFKTNEELNDEYLIQFLNTKRFNNSVFRYSEGGVRSYLFYDNFSSIKIPLPSVDEQQKIANFLTTIDEKIEKTNNQLEKAKAYKKGLLQQMFV